MEYENIEQLIKTLSKLSKRNKGTEATKELTNYWAKARFKIQPDDFDQHFTDGENDGGIDFHYHEDDTFYILQTKFSGDPKKVSALEIEHEIRKLKNTTTMKNPNRRAEHFVNELNRNTNNIDAKLEIIWLTTNIVKPSVRKQIQNDLDSWREENNWLIGIEFVAEDKYELERVIGDVKYGYIPHTGTKILRLEQMPLIRSIGKIRALICIVGVNHILEWFHNPHDIDKFLQKNVRAFVGENKINKDIRKSYSHDPAWFWYKHNGIIIFADNFQFEETTKELVLKNPQVVNGGQTLRALFPAYDKNKQIDHPAEVLLRVYQLPYEGTETHRRSIEIISALNYQNKILPSDLKSTDPRQVRLERLFDKIQGYKYMRKRSKEAKSARTSITMKNLALRYYVCQEKVPHEGVTGNVEELFEENSKYDDIFNETLINNELGSNHVVIKYVTVWSIDQMLRKIVHDLPKKYAKSKQYAKWFVLVDIYGKLMEWKQKKSKLEWDKWVDFVNPQKSPGFEEAVKVYGKNAFRIVDKITSYTTQEPRAFLKTKEATKKFSKKFCTKTSTRAFESLMNKAYAEFQSENE